MRRTITSADPLLDSRNGITARADEDSGEAWTHEQVRDWIDAHGGNVTHLARVLGVRRTQLQSWAADPAEASSARRVPLYIQLHMQTLDVKPGGSPAG